MQMEFQQSEQNANRRRWILVLVDSADGVTGKTGQTGTVEISSNGGSPVASTNSIVEVDAVNMPGHYYIELTAGEIQTLGMISIYYKASGTLAFHDRGFVSYDDPFARHGGFAIEGSGKGKSTGGISKIQAKALLDDIRTIVQEELAKDETEDDVEQKDYTEKLDQILTAVTAEDEPEEPIDFKPILTAIAKIPKAMDYSSQLDKLGIIMKDSRQMDLSFMNKMVSNCETMMAEMSKNVATPIAQIKDMATKLENFKQLMDDYAGKLADQGDMDKRFDAMTQAANNKTLGELTKQIKNLAVEIINLKFELKKRK